MNLDHMMEKSFWRDILYEIISSMDPWDINISDLATEYAKKVDMMKEMNFRVPANVVIVSSVLLRMKSELMSFSNEVAFDPDEWIINPDFAPEEFNCDSSSESTSITDDDFVPITVKPKRVPKRRITAIELIAAIQGVLDDRVVKKKKKEKVEDNGKIIIPLTRDIKKIIEDTYERIMKILSSEEVVLFSDLVNGGDQKVNTFISLLHLSNKEKLKLKQERIFDEIFIYPT